jgi:protein tyrosine/serine phosphatase
MPRPRLRFALALLGLLPACSNFGVVDAGQVYRAAQPDADDLRDWFGEHHIKTILQLRRAEPEAEAKALIARDGVAVVLIPLSARVYPSRAQLLALWDAFRDAEYPVLIHCRAGADRTGLAAAIYVLQTTGDLDRARAQLSLEHLHTGWGTSRLDRVFEMYSRWHGRMDFRRWAAALYLPPEAYSASEPEEPRYP